MKKIQVKIKLLTILLTFFCLLGCSSISSKHEMSGSASKHEIVYSYHNSITISDNNHKVTPEIVEVAVGHCNKFKREVEFISSHPAKNLTNKIFHLFSCNKDASELVAQKDVDRETEIASNRAQEIKPQDKILKTNELSDAHAQFERGLKFRHGIGVKKDITEAIMWYKKAAKQGHQEASFNLGVIFSGNKIVPQNNAKALRWLMKSAEQGHRKSQVNLGSFFANIRNDYIRAYVWTLMAADKFKFPELAFNDEYAELLSLNQEKEIRDKANRNFLLYKSRMRSGEINIARKIAAKCWKSNFKDCDTTILKIIGEVAYDNIRDIENATSIDDTIQATGQHNKIALDDSSLLEQLAKSPKSKRFVELTNIQVQLGFEGIEILKNMSEGIRYLEKFNWNTKDISELEIRKSRLKDICPRMKVNIDYQRRNIKILDEKYKLAQYSEVKKEIFNSDFRMVRLFSDFTASEKKYLRKHETLFERLCLRYNVHIN
jgi:hypothetical protein